MSENHDTSASQGSTDASRPADESIPLTYIPNEFKRIDMIIPDVGTITAKGVDAEVIAEIKAAGVWPTFRRHLKMGQTTCAQFFPRDSGRISLFLFVGVASQGGFISLTAKDSPRTREVMLQMATSFLGQPMRLIALEDGAP